jgi:hypothetical protein
LSAETEAATGVRASRRVRLNASAKWLEPHSTSLVIPSLRLAAHPRLVPRARQCQTIGPPGNCRALEPSAPSAYTPSSPFTAPDEHLNAPLRGRTQRCFAEKLWQVLIYGPRARTPARGTLPVAPEAASGWTTPVALPWAASRPSGSPRSSLHRPCAPAATPQGCRGQSTSPRPRRCRREVELGERRAQGIEARGVGNLSSWTVFGPASGPRRFNGHRLRRRRSRCCSVRS